MLSAQKQIALSAVQSSKLTAERSDALRYYNGDMSKDLPAPEGRSQAVSTDVADTIEGLMPSLMEIFAGADEVVEFNPVGPEDVAAARQETDYINHVFMHQNPGFLTLYSFIKDALLSKVGVVKVWWEEREEEENETYYDLTDDQFAILAADTDVEITEHSEKKSEFGTLHDVTVTKSKTFGECKVLGVPPEEFGIEPTARSIRTCNYCFHSVLKTEDELIQQGYDRAQVKTLPTYASNTNTEEIVRDTVDESTYQGDDFNRATRKIQITEHYVRTDYEGDGRACLYRVTTGGESDEILRRDGQDDIVEFDEIPFAAMSPIIVTHRFHGRSIADLVMDIQRIKTALLRAQLDNAYLANNPRVEVAETFASDNTLDDLLVSRQGGIIRTKQPGGINWQQVPTIGNHVYPLLEYMDQQREMRTGVTRQGQGLDPETLQDQSATAVSQMFTLAQARMRLIARIFAETGVKDMFLLVHGTVRKHGQQPQTVRLLNNWVTVDPRQWKKRTDMTVNVGLGHGGKAEQMAMMNIIAMYQEKALAAGLTNLVSVDNLYSTAKDLAKLAGKKNVDAYFTDPRTQPPPQQQPDPKIMELQLKAQLEDKKAQVDAAHQQWKMQADAALEQQKFEHDKELAVLKAQMDMTERQHQQTMNERKSQIDEFTAVRKLEIEAAKAAMRPSPEEKDAQRKAPLNAIMESHRQMASRQDEMHRSLHDAVNSVAAHMAAPIEFQHDAKGKVVSVKRGGQQYSVRRGVNGKIGQVVPQ